MPIPLQGSCAVQYNGKILLLGGKNEKPSGEQDFFNFWLYLPPYSKYSRVQKISYISYLIEQPLRDHYGNTDCGVFKCGVQNFENF